MNNLSEEKNYKKVVKSICFSYKNGHDALNWLYKQTEDGKKESLSSYVVKLLLEDKKNKMSI